jgi:hypothetical protein
MKFNLHGLQEMLSSQSPTRQQRGEIVEGGTSTHIPGKSLAPEGSRVFGNGAIADSFTILIGLHFPPSFVYGDLSALAVLVYLRRSEMGSNRQRRGRLGQV